MWFKTFRKIVLIEELSAVAALECGLVDKILPTRADANQELERILKILVSTPIETLRARKGIAKSDGNLAVAMVETGKAVIFDSKRDPDEFQSSSLVRTQWHGNGLAVVELFDQDGETRSGECLAVIV